MPPVGAWWTKFGAVPDVFPSLRRQLRGPTLSLRFCQIKVWKAGHKGECAAAVRAGTSTAAKPTPDQMRVLGKLEQLANAADWRGVAAAVMPCGLPQATLRLSTAPSASRISRRLSNLGTGHMYLED